MLIRRQLDSFLRRFEKDFRTLNRIEVSKSALLHNLDYFTKSTGHQVIPVLKGNAYGHGLEQVATALRGRKVPYIAVDNYYEALRIRRVSRQPILILGIIHPENFARLKYDSFAFVVQDEATVRALGATGRSIKVHLECNTGMNRYGVKPHEIPSLIAVIQSYRNLELEGIMSHLADSDGAEQKTIDDAVATFDKCVETGRAVGARPTLIHIAQTAGSLRARSAYANTARIGLGLYGVNPFSPGHELYKTLHHNLRPALTLISTITKIINLQKGERVGYNYTFTAPKEMRIGVLPIGYYEAIDEALLNSGAIKIGDTFKPIVGRVCMNITMIDLDGVTAQIGDEVVIYSNNATDRNTVNATADTYGLFSYSLLTRLSPDVRRILL